MAAHGSSIAALQSSLTTGLSNKADQSAFDVLEGVVATKSTPDGVDLKLSNYSTTAAMNGSIASANNATLATVAANYGLKTVELAGDDENFVVTTDKKDLATRVARRGGQWSDHFKQAASAYNARPHEGGRRETAGHRVQGAARQRRQVPAQQGLDEPAHEGHRGRGGVRAPTNAARSFNLQYGNVQQLRAVDSMTVRSTEGRETLLKLALPAPQGSGNAAARLTRRGRPAAVRQLDDFLGPRRPRSDSGR